MPLAPLCNDTRSLTVVPWAVGALYLVIFLFLVVMRLVRGNRVKLLPFLFGVVVMVGLLVGMRSRYSDEFQEFSLAGDTLTLSYLWPTKAKALPTASIESVAVVRGRHFYKSSRQDDRAWLRVRAGGTSYYSCESSRITDIAQLGRDLGAKTNHPPLWQERCPDPDNRPVPATEAAVVATGRMDVPAACSSAR